MRKIIYILVFLLFFSCQRTTVWKASNWTFKLSEKEIFVKTTKYPGGRFTIFFAPDSLLLDNSEDSIEFRTGSYIQISVDTTDIHVNSQNGAATILNIGNDKYNFKVVSNNIFMDSFFVNHKRKPPYTFISIDTKEYEIAVNGQTIKEGNIHGGW